MTMNYHNCNTFFYERACELFGNDTQQKLADRIGIAQGKISDILSFKAFPERYEKKQPSAEMVVKIAKAFNVSTDYLLGLTDVKSTDTATKELCQTLGLSEETIQALLPADEPIRITKNLRYLWQVNLSERFKIRSDALADLLNWLVTDHKNEIAEHGRWYDNSLLTNLNAFFNLIRCAEIILTRPENIANKEECNGELDTTLRDLDVFKETIIEREQIGLLITSAMYDIQTALNNKKQSIMEQLTRLEEEN